MYFNVKNLMNKFCKFLIAAIFCICSAQYAWCQKVAIKTNLLYDATSTVNAGIEIALAKKWTFDVSGNWNSWSRTESVLWKHAFAQPELRYWFCDRFSGHFIGLHGHGGRYNMGNLNNNIKILDIDFSPLSNYRYQGWFAGGGLTYGHAFILGEHWNLEMGLGVGYAYTKYDKFECAECGSKLAEDVPFHYYGLTKAFINLVYLF